MAVEQGYGGVFGSVVIDTARAILALCSPALGTRASGVATVYAATDTEVSVPRNHAFIPVVNGQRRADLLLKADEGPEADGSWLVTDAGLAVDVLANVGGARYNLPIGTELVPDPPLAGLATARPQLTTATTGGVDATGFGAIKDAVVYESFDGPAVNVDLRRSMLKSFPAIVVAWQRMEPADGQTTSQTLRGQRAGTARALYSLGYTLTLVCPRADSDPARRHEGLAAFDLLLRLLADRHSVDGYKLSSPSPLQIREAYRESGAQEIYQKYYIYTVRLSAMQSVQSIDTREYNLWLWSKIDAVKEQDPELENQGDITVVDDTLVDMTEGAPDPTIPTGFSSGFSGGFGV